ncbi:hypothetical protein BKH43_01360 [Helicobacter sp. 13S00401-1]|uniref:DEAD/DEAH box helicase family protein n=1 Tax=Helicobacter sp. 13S00401-1 TaxID=1905758 RepID=UPI000BA642D6|nr:DEAD/DEAH box helicase family protein [Helicobacter sp. 13S00401-1]PAF51314.1 hypothetical protein BKH43_01360 [Helicobacter sp. 13S00401-1]
MKLSDKLKSALEFSDIEIPEYITSNLNPKLELREYQKNALKHYLMHEKKPSTNHLMFNMATGSGKTLIMVALILELFKKGFSNFIFFVNSNSIVEKTKANFNSPFSSKYLFASKINIDSTNVEINVIDKLSDSKEGYINIVFTTIQALFTTLTKERENAISFEDFEHLKVVLLADEAHHLNAETKSKLSVSEKQNKESWEGVINKILKQNKDNKLLEFSATLPKDKAVLEKYEDKIVYEYTLKEFNFEGYSKNIELQKYSDNDDITLMLGSLLVSMYRQKLASKHNIRLKPVVLLKSKAIKESQKNHQAFNSLIENLDVNILQNFSSNKASYSALMKDAINFLEINTKLCEDIKAEFAPQFGVNMNEEKELERNQLLINSLEDTTNFIRYIFAVDRLNEGWDVLNLFDIVRLGSGSLKDTPREAQLIGRGARLYPFKYENMDRYKRKFDDDINNKLRALETLDYHTFNENKFIQNLQSELVKSGLINDDKEIMELELKENFLESNAYNEWYFSTNSVTKYKDVLKDTNGLFEMDSIEIKRHREKVINVPLFSKDISEASLMQEEIKEDLRGEIKEFVLDRLDKKLIIKVMNKLGDFYNFDNLRRIFKDIDSKEEFIEKYIFKLNIKVSKKQQASFIFKILNYVLNEFMQNSQNLLESYRVNEWRLKPLKLLKNKIVLKKGETTSVGNEEWFVFKTFNGTSLECELIEFIKSKKEDISKVYEKWYLVRNERNNFMAIYSEDARRFEPDFYFFGKRYEDKNFKFVQCFIEPKGSHLVGYEKWKEDFLEKISQQKMLINTDENLHIQEDKKISLTALPFFIDENRTSWEKEFIKELL